MGLSRELINEDALLNSDINLMDGIQFSELVRVVLKRLDFAFGQLDLSGDYGADFIVCKNARKIAIRTMKLTQDTNVGPEIDKAEKAKLHYKTDEAWLISSGIFSGKQIAYAYDRVTPIHQSMFSEWLQKAKQGSTKK